jgi:SAM-dependent methyltransferase
VKPEQPVAKSRFFDAQYAAMEGREAGALDYPLYRFLLPYASSRVDVAAELLQGKRFAHAAELGVGDGALLAKTHAQFDHYDGFDISSYQLDCVAADLRGRPNLRLHRADLEAPLPLGNGAADLVISLSTIEYLRDPEHLVREAFRILRPGGALLLHTMNLAFLPRRMQLLFGRLPTFNSALGWQGGVLHNFTFPTLRALLRSIGFEIEAERCAGLAPALRLWWRNALASDMLFLARRPAPTREPSSG